MIRVSQSLPQISKMTCTLLSNLMSTMVPNKYQINTPIYLFVHFTPHETSSLAIHINMCISVNILLWKNEVMQNSKQICTLQIRVMPENYSSCSLSFIDGGFRHFGRIKKLINWKIYGLWKLKRWTTLSQVYRIMLRIYYIQ